MSRKIFGFTLALYFMIGWLLLTWRYYISMLLSFRNMSSGWFLFLLLIISSTKRLSNLGLNGLTTWNPPMTCTSTAGSINTPTSTTTVEDNIRNIEENISVTQGEVITRTDNNGRLQGYFCSDVVFILSHKVLTDLEISVLGKGLGFSPTPTFINEADLRRDFADFARKMRCKWFFFTTNLRKALVKFQHSGLSLIGVLLRLIHH